MPQDLRIRDCRVDQIGDDELCLTVEIDDAAAGRAQLRGVGVSATSLREAAIETIGRSPFARHLRLERDGLLIADPAQRCIVGALEAARCDAVGKLQALPLHAWLGGALKTELPVAVILPPGRAAATRLPSGIRRVVVTSHDYDLEHIFQALTDARAKLADDIELALQLAGQCEAADLGKLLAAGRNLRLTHIADPCADALAATLAFARGLPALALTAHRYPIASLQPSAAAGGAQVLLLDPIALGGPDAVRALATLAQLHGIEAGLTAAAGTAWQARYAAGIAATLAVATEPLVVEATIAAGLALKSGRLSLATAPGIEGEPAAAAFERAMP